MASESSKLLEQPETDAGDDDNNVDDPTVARWLTKAQDGEETAQLALGVHYLSLADTEESNGRNGRLAVDWLIKASRQGSEMATERLKECQRRKIGIDSANIEDVEWCVTTTRFEKEAREAARQLFYRLKPLGVGDNNAKLSAKEFAAGIGLLPVNKKEKKLLEKAGNLGKDQMVSEEHFVKTVVRRLYGQGSASSMFSTEGDWDAFHKSSWIEKLTRYPGMTASYLADAAIDAAGSQGAQWLRMLVPVNQIYTLVAFVVYSVVSVDAVLWLLPLIAFYSLFAVLLVVTAQMLRSRTRLGDLRTVAALLNRFTEVAFDADSAESSFSWKSLKPYATFFAVLPLCVAALSAADAGWVPSPELMALSSVAAATSFFALNDRYDKLAIGSMIIDVVFTALPGAVRQLPRIPVVHSVLWYTIGPGYAVSLPIPGLRVMFGMPSAAFVVVPLIFVRMASKRSWKGTYQILVPHLVCFFWWRLAVTFFSRSSWFGLTRALVGWIGLLVMLPVFGFILLGYVVYVVFNAMSLANVLKVLTTVALIAGASAYAMWSRSGYSFGSFFSLEGKGKSPLSRAAILLALVLGSCLVFAIFFRPSIDAGHDENNLLPWSTYHKYCGRPNDDASCAPYAGAPMAGSGQVQRISIIRVENPAEAFAGWLPAVAAGWLSCTYGTQYPADCDTVVESEAERDACRYNTRRGQRCHMRNLDRNSYEIVVVSQNGDTIRLTAADWFQEPASYIRPGHEVSFRARLSDGRVGSSGVTLGLSSIQCTSCDDEAAAAVHRHRSGWHILQSIRVALHAVWNFFLNPVFAFV